MNSTVLQLEQTHSALRDAMQRADWEAIGGLDQQCRQAVDLALTDPHTPVEVLRDRMQELLDLYRELVEACTGERQRIAGELVQMNQSKKKAKVYQLFG
ncbi:MAG: flagellar protein FliT [Thiopseudomonas sp.]|nr:flagellar protein FliT [Gammaproteobacteria bacterium]